MKYICMYIALFMMLQMSASFNVDSSNAANVAGMPYSKEAETSFEDGEDLGISLLRNFDNKYPVHITNNTECTIVCHNQSDEEVIILPHTQQQVSFVDEALYGIIYLDNTMLGFFDMRLQRIGITKIVFKKENERINLYSNIGQQESYKTESVLQVSEATDVRDDTSSDVTVSDITTSEDQSDDDGVDTFVANQDHSSPEIYPQTQYQSPEGVYSRDASKSFDSRNSPRSTYTLNIAQFLNGPQVFVKQQGYSYEVKDYLDLEFYNPDVELEVYDSNNSLLVSKTFSLSAQDNNLIHLYKGEDNVIIKTNCEEL